MPIRCAQPDRLLDLVEQRRDEVHVARARDLRDHDLVELVAGLLDDVDDVAVAPVGVEAVDAQRHRAAGPVLLAQRVDDVQARLRLVVGRDRVLEVEHHDVRSEARGLLEHADVAAGDGELTAVETAACGSSNTPSGAGECDRTDGQYIGRDPLPQAVRRESVWVDGSTQYIERTRGSSTDSVVSLTFSTKAARDDPRHRPSAPRSAAAPARRARPEQRRARRPRGDAEADARPPRSRPARDPHRARSTSSVGSTTPRAASSSRTRRPGRRAWSAGS